MTTVRQINGAVVADEYGTTFATFGANATWNSAAIPSRNADGPINWIVGHIDPGPVVSGTNSSIDVNLWVSVDGVNWTNVDAGPTAVGQSYDVTGTGGVPTSFLFQVVAPFTQIRVTNSAVATTLVKLSLSPRNTF